MNRISRRGVLTATVTFLLWSGAAYSVATQEKTISQAEASGEKAPPPVVISFEGMSEGDGYRDVLLRLRNDTRYDIMLTTGGPQFINGRLDYNSLLQDGARILVKFSLQDVRSGEIYEPLEGRSDTNWESQLPSGSTIIFRVPLSHFKSKFDLIIPYRYAGDDQTVERKAYFNAYDLPAGKVK